MITSIHSSACLYHTSVDAQSRLGDLYCHVPVVRLISYTIQSGVISSETVEPRALWLVIA